MTKIRIINLNEFCLIYAHLNFTLLGVTLSKGYNLYDNISHITR